MSIQNIDYKKISFTRSDGVFVSLISALQNPFDLAENFPVLKLEGIDTPKETKLFYWITPQRWTLSELVFFAQNNDLCMRIEDKQGNTLTSYGNCGTDNRIFGFPFDINFK